LESKWPINAISIHPAGKVVAIGTGSYDGGYNFEGELLIRDTTRGTTVSVLASDRDVVDLAWLDPQTLRFTMAPWDDEEELPEGLLPCQTVEISRNDWCTITAGSIGQKLFHPDPQWHSMGLDITITERTWGAMGAPSTDEPSALLADLASKNGQPWAPRRLAWAVLPFRAGVVVGLDHAIERWNEQGDCAWSIRVDGVCTQLFADQPTQAIATVSSECWGGSTQVLVVDLETGSSRTLARAGGEDDWDFGAALTTCQAGYYLIRPIDYSNKKTQPSQIVSAVEPRGEVRLTAYDAVNHYFDVRRAPELFLLVGPAKQSHTSKQVAVVRPKGTGWKVEPLFSLTWEKDAHLFGGPGVWVDDEVGPGIIHTGSVYTQDTKFVVRRAYPDGGVIWMVPLEQTVTGIDEWCGTVVAATHTGMVVAIDTMSGEVRAGSPQQLLVDGAPLAALSLALVDETRGWVGTHDGRVIEVHLSAGT
jgi:hypothetical protein